jgi:hypothetical protein
MLHVVHPRQLLSLGLLLLHPQRLRQPRRLQLITPFIMQALLRRMAQAQQVEQVEQVRKVT